jgi:hypothetical protein
MKTFLLLMCSNVYDHRLVRPPEISQGAAFSGHRGELADRVLRILLSGPANRIGYGEFTAFQLKIIQEVIHSLRIHRFRVAVSRRSG